MKETELREPIPYGYVTWTGRVASNGAVDRYNRLQEEINAFIKEGRPVPEFLLDLSHEAMVLCGEG